MTEPEPREVAEIGSAAEFTCALPQDTGRFLVPPSLSVDFGAARPARGVVPDSFTPVEAVVCDIDVGDQVSADGTTTYFERHYIGDLSAAVAAFNALSARQQPLDLCGSIQAAAPVDTWLIGADGRAVQPSLPLGECGIDNTLGLFEIDKLPQATAVEHRLRLDNAGISHFYGCSPILSPATPGPRSLLELSLSPTGFCRFDTSGLQPTFLGASRYDTDPNNNWDSGLPDLESADVCSERAISVATTTTGTNPATGMPFDVQIELGGCRRVLADGYIPRVVPPRLLATLDVPRR